MATIRQLRYGQQWVCRGRGEGDAMSDETDEIDTWAWAWSDAEGGWVPIDPCELPEDGREGRG